MKSEEVAAGPGEGAAAGEEWREHSAGLVQKEDLDPVAALNGEVLLPDGEWRTPSADEAKALADGSRRLTMIWSSGSGPRSTRPLTSASC